MVTVALAGLSFAGAPDQALGAASSPSVFFSAGSRPSRSTSHLSNSIDGPHPADRRRHEVLQADARTDQHLRLTDQTDGAAAPSSWMWV